MRLIVNLFLGLIGVLLIAAAAAYFWFWATPVGINNLVNKLTVEFMFRSPELTTGLGLVDNTPPNVTHHVPPPDGLNGWYVTQIPVTVNAIDPGGDNASGVKQTICWRGDERWFFYGGVQTVTVTEEGVGGMGCTAEDLAGNVGSGGFGARRDEIETSHHRASRRYARFRIMR